MDDAESVVADLPDCLIVEIFSRLPIKSLCRFKCVSKFCLSFIENPSFVEQKRPKTPFLWQIQLHRELRVYSVDSTNGFSSLKHSYKLEDADVEEFLGYSEGLNYLMDYNLDLHVCNIVTKERITLPRWCDGAVFGFDPASKTYKILGGKQKSSGMPYDFQVLTLGSDPYWRPVTNTFEMDFLVQPGAPLVNGELFWLHYNEDNIISFNFANEKFRVIDLPDEVTEEVMWYRIFEFEGSLAFVKQHRIREPTFSMWILKETHNRSVWVMMKENITMPFETTNLRQFYTNHESLWTVFRCDFSSRGGELLVSERDHHRYVCSYSFLNSQFKMMQITGLPAIRNSRVRNFVEKYVSLKELVRHH